MLFPRGFPNFGPETYLNHFNLGLVLYSDPHCSENDCYCCGLTLTNNVLVNGFRTDKIDIEQSVKQGDALSCSLFILCMDPLIQKVNSDDTIEGLNIGNPIRRVQSYSK